ncbi:MAG: MarR family transcriptional regulator [Roseiflexaceae bacterium]|nr:MarR family transcriptional regulator [Roseiflexaceae bacterium]
MQETISFALSQAGKAHRAAVDTALRAFHIHVGQEMILMRLWEQEGQTQTQLAEQLCVEPPTVTRMIQRMETEGLLERRPDPEDARIQRVFLAPSGRALRQQIEACWDQVEAATVAGFTMEERMLLRRLLLQVRDNLI